MRKFPAEILVFLLNNSTYSTKVSKQVNATFSHTAKVITQLEEMKFLEKSIDQRNKRRVLLTLTPKGRKLAEYFRKVKGILNELDGADES